MSKRFPQGFVWGAATAAHQVEGGNDNCDTWVEECVPGSPYADKSGDAIDHFHRFEEDIALMASVGLKGYRFSIEWARVEPSPGEFSQAAIAHYRQVLDACDRHGLQTMVTLHHFSSPKWLMGLGGWQGEQTPALFARYVEVVMKALGNRIPRVITINECNIGVLLQGMFEKLGFVPPVGMDAVAWRAPEWRRAAAAACGTTPERYCGFQMAGSARGMATIAAAHRAARDVIRRVSPATQVGMALALSQVQVLPGGEQSGAKSWHENFRQWLPVIEGDDMFCVHNYTRAIFGPEGQVQPPPESGNTQMGYEYCPSALAGAVRAVARDLKIPLYITESGIATDDDGKRAEFIQSALAGLHECIAEGIDVRGYFYWSAFDNFEWVFGYACRFGLIAVDRKTQARTIKPSAHAMGRIARDNALPDGASVQVPPGKSIDLPAQVQYQPDKPMTAIVFTNVRIFDGSGAAPFDGEVRVDENRISAVARNGQTVSRDNARVIDGAGGTLMPGLTEAHAHLTWPTSVEKFVPGMELPPEELALTAARNARILLDHGFTSAYSGGALSKRIEIALRDQIESGGMPGPRLIPSSIEREPPSEGYLKGAGVDEHGRGPESVAAFVKGCADMGAKSIKFLLSGESALKPGASLELLYSEEEVQAAGRAARENGVWLTAHCHANESVKMAVRAGFRVLYHCTFADTEALDMLEAARDKIFIAPSIGILVATLDATPPPHIDMSHMKADAQSVLALQRKLVPELRRRGLRLLPGGDYGFPFNPTGRNARDLELWVEYLGYTPTDALVAATRLGGEIMGRGNELGQVQPGYLADLLLVTGDPTRNVAILQNKNNLRAIMKDGRFYKAPNP